MNTELLRGDERKWLDSNIYHEEEFAQRLIEEREKNADLNQELNSLSDGLREVERELAEAQKDSERLDWLFKCQTVTLTIGKSGLRGYVLDRAAIDAAMKE